MSDILSLPQRLMLSAIVLAHCAALAAQSMLAARVTSAFGGAFW